MALCFEARTRMRKRKGGSRAQSPPHVVFPPAAGLHCPDRQLLHGLLLLPPRLMCLALASISVLVSKSRPTTSCPPLVAPLPLTLCSYSTPASFASALPPSNSPPERRP